MTIANHLINALASQDQDEANAAFDSMIQDKMSDYLEVKKVELASTIMDDLQEGSGVARQYVRQVGAMIAKSPAIAGGPGRSLHRDELKTHARKIVKKLGKETVKSHADTIRDTRANVKLRARMQGEEAIVEGGPTRKHFQQTADLLKNIPDEAKRKELAQHHAGLYKAQNPRFDRAKFMAAAGVNEETVNEVLSGGSKKELAPPSNAQLNRNVMANIRKAVQTLRVKGVNPTMAAAGHRDFAKLVAKNPKAPGYMLLRKLAPAKAQAVQSLTQAGVPLGGSLEAHPNDFNQVVQRIKRFK